MDKNVFDRIGQIIVALSTGAGASSAAVFIHFVSFGSLQVGHFILVSRMVTHIKNMIVKVTFEQEGCLERIEKEVRGEKHCSIAQRVGQRAACNPSQLSQILNVHHPLISRT